MNRLGTLAVLLCAAALAACEKNGVQQLTAAAPQAQIKFFNFANGAPGVNFYANDQKLTAVGLSTCSLPTVTDSTCFTTGLESTNGVAQGGAGNAGFYSSVNPGQYTLNGRIAAATDKGLQVVKVTQTLDASKRYSMYTSGNYDATAKSMDAFVVEDQLPEIDLTSVYVRFVNGIYNSGPVVLWAKNTTTGDSIAVGGPVAYRSAGAFTKVPGSGTYDLAVRAQGSTTVLYSRSAVTFSLGRVYTIATRGDATVTSTTATNRPQLDNTANR